MYRITSLTKIVGVAFLYLLFTVLYVNIPVFADTTAPNVIPAGCSADPDGLLSASALGIPTYGCGGNTSIVETVMKLVFAALAMVSLLFLVIGGFKYTVSGGDSNAIASAKKTITYAVLGLVLGLSVFTIIGFVFSWLKS